VSSMPRARKRRSVSRSRKEKRGTREARCVDLSAKRVHRYRRSPKFSRDRSTGGTLGPWWSASGEKRQAHLWCPVGGIRDGYMSAPSRPRMPQKNGGPGDSETGGGKKGCYSIHDMLQ